MAASQKGTLNETLDLAVQIGERHLPERVLKWVVLAAVDFMFLAGVAKLAPDTTVGQIRLTTVLGVILAFLLAAAVWNGLWRRRSTTVHAPVMRAKVVIGCRIGRRSVDCGAVKAERRGVKVNSFRLTTIGPPYRSSPTACSLVAYDKDQLIRETVRGIGAIAEQILASGLPSADAIAIAVPGTVEVEGNEIASTELPVGPDIVETLCDGLRDDSEVRPWIEKLFGVDLNGHPNPLDERIFLDNDVRSAARYHALVGHRHCAEAPRHTVVVNVGLGVKASLALEGSVYYGNHSAAGEVCGVECAADGQAKSEKFISSHRRSIGDSVGLQGLDEISRGIDRHGTLRHLLGSYCASHNRHVRTPNRHNAECRQLFARDPEHGLLRFIIDTSSPHRAMAAEILQKYSQRLATVLASLAATIDPEEIVVYGSVIEALLADPEFKGQLSRRRHRTARPPDPA